MERIIFHVDVNSAFLSWEAAKRVKNGEEDIRLIPSAVGDDREKRTGVILAKSIPAKKRGIITGEPVAMAVRKCPELFLVQPDFKLYEKNSKAFMDICREYAPVVEKYSIDECFLDMSGTQLLYPDPIALAYEIKDKIKSLLGFTVNIGIGSNKLLAKMASDFEKPDKVHTLFIDDVESKLWPLPIRELFTVGRMTAKKLEIAGILTVGDLANSDVEMIKAIVGNKAGEQIFSYANGLDESIVLAQPEKAKSYSVSTTLEEDVTDKKQAFRIFLSLADNVAARMRRDGFKAFCIGITIRSNDFKNKSRQRKLYSPTDITDEIYNLAIELFCELWDANTPIRLLGVSLSNLIEKENVQRILFDNEDKNKSEKLDRAIDELRRKYGNVAIGRASVLGDNENIAKKYKAQMENLDE